MKIIRPTAIRDTGGAFTRASTATYYDSTGTLQIAAINTPRINYHQTTFAHIGLLIETASTNILLNSATAFSQSLSTLANTYTISFTGTGTVTLSGAATLTLVGTGVSARVSATFVSSGGTITVTATGTTIRGQIELGTIASSYIPTTSTTITRAADVVTGSGFIYSDVVEGGATLLNKHKYLNTSTTVAVTAQSYVLSFYGIGSISLSGTFVGSLAGTGLTNRVFLTFTPSAGNLILTVQEEVTSVQLETGNILGPFVNEKVWNALTDYQTGDRVSRVTNNTHIVYENVFVAV